jgi:hypothetical protein
LLEARIELGTNPKPVARAMFEQFQDEVGQLRITYNTLVTAIATATAQTQGTLLIERSNIRYGN